MEVPDELPSKEDGVGLLPSTVIVKSDGSASPPPSLITCLVTNNVPGCDALLESPFDVGTKEDGMRTRMRTIDLYQLYL
jgi:hypothetical protein